KARRAGRERENPIELGPSDERRRGDLVEVLDVRTTGAETREDVVDDSAAERIETDVDGVRRGDQLAVAHDVPHRELARAGPTHETRNLLARGADHPHLACKETRDPLRLGTAELPAAARRERHDAARAAALGELD